METYRRLLHTRIRSLCKYNSDTFAFDFYS